MKTTKDLAEISTQEIERISKGEVRKDVIQGLDQCCNALIKLARLEMDYAWRDWNGRAPNVPWMATKAIDVQQEPHSAQQITPSVQLSTQSRDLATQVEATKQQLKTASGTMKQILTDKLVQLSEKYNRSLENRA